MEGGDRLRKEVVVEQQEVLGTVEVEVWNHPVLVLAETWPSFAFAAQAVGCLDIKTWCKFGSAKSKVEFMSTRLGSTLAESSLEELVKLYANQPTLTVLIQGDATFCNRFRKWSCQRFPLAKTLELTLECDSNRWDETFLWKGSLSHRALGGVTSGTWLYRCSESLAEPRKGLTRNLGLLLKPTHGGRALSRTSDELVHGREPLKGNNLIQPGAISPWVIASSVFTKDGDQVIRRLQVDELMDVYDIEVITQKELGRHWRLGQCSSSCAFALTTPLKVAIEASRLFYDRLRSDGWGAHLLPVNDLIGDRKRTNDDERDRLSTDETMDTKRLKPTTEEVRPENGLAAKASTLADEKLAAQEAASTNPSVKATKSDDAKVNEKHWDVWSVDNYKPSNGDAAKVCIPGSYCPSKHGRLFNGLRSLAVRWYRKRILKSFLSYLHEQHGGGMFTQETVSSGTTFKAIKVSVWVKLRYKLKALKSRKSKGRGRKDLNEFRKDLLVGREAVWRATLSSWWNWDGGSTIYFWRWPRCHRVAVRDGTKAFIHRHKLPAYGKPQQLSRDPETRNRVKDKVNGVRGRRYIQPGGVKSTTGFFDVPKGDTDIRMVYDATKCGLNDALWTPNFFLPTIDSILRNADDETWFGDIDLGEMFLNYWLDEELRPYAGVDVSLLGDRIWLKDGSTVFEEVGVKKKIWERWERTLMGFQSSPYLCTQSFGWSEDFIKGDISDHRSNPLAWKEVVLNLPGSKTYQPTRPWVYRTKFDGSLAAFFGTYIDDIRTGDSTEDGCRKTTRRVASRVNYLGQQDAARKRRPPSKKPGAWSGAMCESVSGKGLFVTCSQDKWNKAKEIVLRRYTEVVKEGSDMLDFKTLERDVGFLVHLSRTFPSIFPYLRGIYNTLNGWRKGRDHDGWKLTRREWDLFLAMEEGMEDEDEQATQTSSKGCSAGPSSPSKSSRAPGKVKPVPRLSRDLTALQRLFSDDKPPLRLVRGQLIHAVKYAFGDASKAGFGASWISSQGVKYRFGTWGRDMDSGSSNLRELKNLVDTLKKMADGDELEGSEIFIFTDNSTAEAAFFKGSSKSKLLFELILELRELEMKCKTKIHFVHVAGTRMIAQGSDGLSRGNLSEGVMKGTPMDDFIPLNESALDRSHGLKSWLESWTGEDLEFLGPKDWFVRGHDIVEGEFEVNVDGFKWPTYRKGTFVWSPPPAAAESMLEELRKARHRRTTSTHLILIPRLLTPMWLKHLNKVSDIVLSIPAGHHAWPAEMHEPLTIGIVFPLLRCNPWQLRRSPVLLELERKLREVWKAEPSTERPFLLKLWQLPRKLAGLSQKLVWKMLRGSSLDPVSNSPPGKRRRL